MRLIKLDAIESTNEFLKALANDQDVQNFTVVTAEKQTRGKGQMGAKWEAETGKNLIMSILCKDSIGDTSNLFLLNVAVAVAVAEVISVYEVTDSAIKWPNDIMADGKKIGGILIENTFGTIGIRSVIGIGLNVNQLDFPNLPRASSLAMIAGREWDRDLLRDQIVDSIQKRLENAEQKASQLLKSYNALLFRKGTSSGFKDATGSFDGKIINVGIDGLLRVEKSDGQIINYDLKQIEMMY